MSEDLEESGVKSIEIPGVGTLLLNSEATVKVSNSAHFDFRNSAGEPVRPIGYRQFSFRRGGVTFGWMRLDGKPPYFTSTIVNLDEEGLGIGTESNISNLTDAPEGK